MRRLFAVILAVWLCRGSTARADDMRHVCTEAATRGQELRLEQKWMAARDEFRRCADDACPGPVRESCGPWLAEASEKVPSLLLQLSDASDGLAIPESKTFIDGHPVRAGAPLEMDPGRHMVRVQGVGYLSHEEEVTMREGERDRTLAIALEPLPLMPSIPDASPAPKRPPPFTVVGASTAAAGLLAAGVGAVVFATGRASIPAGCNRGTHVCDTFANTLDAESARGRANFGAGLLLGGAIGVAAGSLLFVLGLAADRSVRTKPAALLTGLRW